ncbi:hypothetical protein Ddye_019372 [Dipteronia dyeriana]|uniref:DUF4408 domain-containing protein n=1 Tax=Dipteronia dyeriana TaxID=168575 RepID=A0AAD9WVN8_9ROSI|nr:hypothetical protein Ddye_019372 [Dipteronia dyeriana]
MVRSNTWILSLKVIFMSTGVLSMALLLKMSVPLVMDFSISRAPVMWSSFLSWLKPPYLYLIINGIIITIVASSRFYHNDGDDESMVKTKPDFVGGAVSAGQTPDLDYEMKMSTDFGSVAVSYEEKRRVEEEETVTTSAVATPVFEEEKSVVVVGGGVVVGLENATWTPPRRMDSSEIHNDYDLTAEKPLVSARFGHRKPIKGSPEGGSRALRVAKPKRHETLENTWKTITEGRAMPLNRHLKKSDTWENHHHQYGRQINVVGDVDTTQTPEAAVKKAETFRDRTNYQQLPALNNNSPASAGKLRKEPSLSQDELNRRVEAFIKKFNEEMRLQRQESLNQYKEMTHRGL